MVNIKADFDSSNIEKAERAINAGGKKAVDRAKKRALKSGASTFSSAAKGGAPAIYKIKPSDLKSVTSVHDGMIEIKSRRYTMGVSPSHFAISPKNYESQKGKPVKRRKRVSVTVKKGSRRAFPHGFIANPDAINGGHVMIWKREGKEITPVRSLSAAQMATNPEVEEAIMKAINETYEKRLDHELERMGL